MQTLKLTHPVMINGEEANELPYDFEEMTGNDLLSASRNMALSGYTATSAAEIDVCYHTFLFAKAVEVASERKIATVDVLRISARDLQTGGSLARDFFYLQ